MTHIEVDLTKTQEPKDVMDVEEVGDQPEVPDRPLIAVEDMNGHFPVAGVGRGNQFLDAT